MVNRMIISQIKEGHTYCGRMGDVRLVINIKPAIPKFESMVRYKDVATGKTGIVRITSFARWAEREVVE